MSNKQTYGEVCDEIANWFNSSFEDRGVEVRFDRDDIMSMNTTFPALAIFGMKTYVDSGLDATTVMVSDEEIAKYAYKKIQEKKNE